MELIYKKCEEIGFDFLSFCELSGNDKGRMRHADLGNGEMSLLAPLKKLLG